MNDESKCTASCDGFLEGRPDDRVYSKYKKKNQFKEFWRRIKRNKLALFGMTLFLFVILVAIFADFIVPYELAIRQEVSIKLDPPSVEHILGTDNYGRDIFARIVHGTRYTLMIGLAAVLIGISTGCIIGAAAGYFGGIVDTIIMRIMDTIVSIPFMLLALTIVAALGPGLFNLVLALIISNIPMYTRVIRSAMLNVIDMDYIEAARSCGTRDCAIIMKHILPNALGVIIVQATMTFGSMIISASTMSFLGLGIQPPSPEWGAMLSEGKNFMLYAPHIVVFPGLAIVLTVLALNLMGDGLRDALDPRLKD